MSIDVKPYTALVTCPDAVAMSVGSAKNARYATELPSSSRNNGIPRYDNGVPAGYHPPLEEYLEAIHELEEEGALVIQARLAERVGHSAPAVSETIRRLKADGYVTVQDRCVQL